ncbi:lysophospholipid acyltransferase family protein [Neorhodopirellula pilleata]|uniref:Lipid A biosynthesis lauroyl acyltransferase n=1 Tax=Neorhodopirellula pilleata TaxID=2714738 RepID=A0A5C5ZXI9_9BACT|nr:lysophospholipid acyltransferase family protein [Neorhodopirellula pilleata]TWT91856.1 Lipid A biosynthesis lauroyl acyltransferase [Neorhodopirellula pilleata]
MRSLLPPFVDFIAYAAVRLVVAFVQAMPLDMGDHLCRNLAWLLSGPLPVRRKEIDDALDRIFPGVDPIRKHELTRAMWHHLMLMVCEVAWAQRRLHRSNWREHVVFRGNREMLRASFSPRPAVMVSGHFGHFEIGSYTMGLMGLETLAIARNLDNRFLHRWVENFRGAKGQQIVDKNGCAPIVDAHLRGGGTLSLLADQHAGEKGLWVDFCGQPASCHKALALFSLANDAPMLAVYTRRIGGRPMQFESAMLAQADPRPSEHGHTDPHCESVATLTHWYNRQLEAMIDLAPEQYWWLHRRWRTPSEKVAKRLAKQTTARAA